MSRAVRTLSGADAFGAWRERVALQVGRHLRVFVDRRFGEHLCGSPEARVMADVLMSFVTMGKYLRSTFVVAGWLCGGPVTPAAVRAAASAELLHCFALLQDDVMDESATRRGAPAAHVRFARWFRESGRRGSAERFGESAAVLAGDLCLVWAGQMLRESGVGAAALERVAGRYDWLRSELAVGQLRDLANHSSSEPSLDEVLAIARAKSGRYTVRRPLELGADLAGCDDRTLAALARYGDAVGAAFQLRDDLLGLFGDPATTGKPLGDDLRTGKATSTMVLARDLATPEQRRRLDAPFRDADVPRLLDTIRATGAVDRAEQCIQAEVDRAIAATADLPEEAARHLVELAHLCARRSH